MEHHPLRDSCDPDGVQQPRGVNRGNELKGVDELIREYRRERDREGQKQQGKHQLTGEASAREMLGKEFPKYYPWYSVKEYTYNNIRQFNRNRLLWLDDNVDGIKTGHTESAGYCLVASARKDDMRLISIILGTDSDNARASSSRKLLSYGFRFYETFLLHRANEPLENMRIWKGENETVPLGLQEDLYITIPRGQRNKVKANMTVETRLVAPAKKGQTYGSVNIMLGEEKLRQQSLVALEDVPEGGLWRQMIDNIRLLFD